METQSRDSRRGSPFRGAGSHAVGGFAVVADMTHRHAEEDVAGTSRNPAVYHRLLAAADEATFPTEWTLTGRDRERRLIQEGLRAAPTRSIVIVGPSGVGRTRLVREAFGWARDLGRPTRWAQATSAAASVPLGALAHLIPPVEAVSDTFTLLQRAMSAFDQGGDEPVVVIDDAHLLDELSVTLVQQLVNGGHVTLVLAIRAGAAPNSLSALWKDGLATRIELQPLSREDSDRLVGAALAGQVDTRTGERLWGLSCGNPLFLRELVEGGLAAGCLREQGGVWQWDGETCLTPRLVEIVLAELGDMDAMERVALEVLAIGEPLSLERLVGLSPREAVVGLERRGLVTVDRTARFAEARTAHPLYAEVLRGQMPEAAADRIRRRLAHGSARSPFPDDLLRRCRMLLDSDEPELDADLLTEAACRANAMFDHGLAERLARAAVHGGAGIRAHLALVETVLWQGRSADAEALAVAADRLTASAPDRSRLVMMRALNLFSGLGRTADAETELEKAAAGMPDGEGRDALAATLALVAFLDGRPERAVGLGTTVMAGAHRESCAHPLAAAARVAGLAVSGRPTEALQVATAGWAALERVPSEAEVAFVRLELAQGELLALWLAGRFGDLERRAAELHQRSMTVAEWAGDAVAAMHVGRAALCIGRLRAATRWLTEAVAGMRRRDPAGLLPLCSAHLAQAHAQLGDAEGARELLASASTAAASRRVAPAFEPQMLLARAWHLAAEGQHPAAADMALRAGARAAEHGQWGFEAVMLHGAVQFGQAGDVAVRLRQLSESFGGPLLVVCAAHAEAAASNSGRRLDEVAAEFETLGAMLLAADAYAQAAAAHGLADDPRLAAVSAAAATGLARGCDEARTPALDLLTPPRLTSREQEVGCLAAEGLTNLDIAERLVLSVRTVEAHLAHAYTKLGITKRAQLRGVIGNGGECPDAGFLAS